MKTSIAFSRLKNSKKALLHKRIKLKVIDFHASVHHAVHATAVFSQKVNRNSF